MKLNNNLFSNVAPMAMQDVLTRLHTSIYLSLTLSVKLFDSIGVLLYTISKRCHGTVTYQHVVYLRITLS
jgi:hypothetical protein